MKKSLQLLTSRLLQPGYSMLMVVWAFLFMQYMLRVSDSAIIPELSHSFAIEASGMGLLSSVYYVVYALMQIPAGLLYDRMSIKKVLSLSLLLLGLSALLMGFSPNFSTVLIARIIMGVSSAFALVGALKIIAVYIDTQQRSLWIGVTMTVATLGAVCGQEPWLLLTDVLGHWRYPYYLMGVITLVIGLLALWPSQPNKLVKLPKNYANSVQILQQKLADSSFVALLLFVGFLSAPITVFAAFWAVPFFYQAMGFERHLATSLSSLSWVGGLLGGPLLGFIADYFHVRKLVLIYSGLFAAAIMLLVIFLPIFSPLTIGLLLFILGVLCNAIVVIFAQISEIVPQATVGLFMGLVTTANIIVTPVLQLFVGFILSSTEQASLTQQSGSSAYSLPTYQLALVIIPVILLITTLHLVRKARI